MKGKAGAARDEAPANRPLFETAPVTKGERAGERLQERPQQRMSKQPLVALTGRELDAIQHIGRFRFLTSQHVAEFLFAGTSIKQLSREVMTRRMLKGLVDKGIASMLLRGRQAALYYLTPRGALEFDSPLPPTKRAPTSFLFSKHALMLADIALAFHRTAREHEGHAVADFLVEKECEQRYGKNKLIPDAYMIYETPKVTMHAWLEADTGDKSTKFIQKIIHYTNLYRSDEWRQHLDTWPRILVVSRTDSQVELLKKTTERLDTDEGVAFWFTSVDALKHDAFAMIWRVAFRDDVKALLTEEQK